MARKARFNRDHALDSAVQLFWQRGYANTSMKQIEQALDMRPGSLYATFGNKDGLFHEALDRYARLMAIELDMPLLSCEAPLTALIGFLERIGQQLARLETPSRACLMVKVLLESTEEQPELREHVDMMLNGMETHVTHLLEKAREQGELREGTDCARLARLIQAQIIGLRCIAHRGLPPEQIQALTADMSELLNGYRCRH